MAESQDVAQCPVVTSQPEKNTNKARNELGNDLTTQDGEPASDRDSETPGDSLIQITVILPQSPDKFDLMISPHEPVHELRQSIQELPVAFQHSCFHLEHAGERLNDFVQVSDVPGLGQGSEVRLILDPYSEKEARLHFIRIRELIGAAGDRPDTIHGILAGTSVFDTVLQDTEPRGHYNFESPLDLNYLLPKEAPSSPKTVKAISLSPWNPPPAYLRQKGHHLYLLVTTNEGEQYHITSYIGGFYVNRSSNTKFDPSPRPPPKNAAGHSLLTVLEDISPSFSASFRRLQEFTNQRDPLITFQITNSTPEAPWLVPPLSSASCIHQPDIARSQESYLISGIDGTDTLRDWNEEFQSARELPRDSVQDRIFRERLSSKLFADYTEAAAKGAVLVARGEVTPLNPTEDQDAQIFVYNNVFFSFGADGVGTFTSEGGDEAARVATGKDVMGVRLVNQLDIDGVFTPATVVVDYLGRRIVGQSIVPGIFKQREPGENQIDYGAVDGKDVVAADEKFAPDFAKLSSAFKVKKHPVWDKNGKRFDLEGSVETKGLLGTDGRKYVLDLYRITPLDIAWLEEHEAKQYPHRMTVLRPELVDAYARQKMRDYLAVERKKAQEAPDEMHQANPPGFNFGLNPDVFTGQTPRTDAEKEEMAADEQDVRDICAFLREKVIPDMLRDLEESETAFPTDGRSLRKMVHKRGINIRYLGKIASLCCEPKLNAMLEVCQQDMISRAFKHMAGNYLKCLPPPLASACTSHLLNCLLGHGLDPLPQAEIDQSARSLYLGIDISFSKVTPDSLRQQIELEVTRRYRYILPVGWQNTSRKPQLLREVALKLGLQLRCRSFNFTNHETNGFASDVASGEESKKKKKKPVSGSETQIFRSEDIANIVPVIKDSAPRSMLAEDAMEAGRISLAQRQKKIGQDLLLESLSLHEQIYGILHPEVSRVYHQLSLLYFQIDEKDAAVELARKAVIVSERTIGIDSEETLLNYLNLSLILHQTGDSSSALAYAQHALNLWKIMYGAEHPDSVTTINNAAVMLQNVKAYHESRRWFEQSLKICERVFGKKSVNSATLLFQLAQALALDGDAGGAVNKMRDSYTIFKEELGPDDKNTKEAESWLDQLTQSAVAIRRNAKEIEARRLRAGIKFPTRVPTQADATQDKPGAVDSRSIDELLKFIEGTDQKKGAKKKPGQGNPKRRGKI